MDRHHPKPIPKNLVFINQTKSDGQNNKTSDIDAPSQARMTSQHVFPEKGIVILRPRFTKSTFHDQEDFRCDNPKAFVHNTEQEAENLDLDYLT